MPAFYGPWLQLEWAGRHLESLTKEVDSFEKRNRIRPMKYSNSEGHVMWQGKLRDFPPPRVGFLAGDTIHNMRACLDHLAWQLAWYAGHHPPDRSTGFPIVQDVNRWNTDTVKKMVRHVPQQARELMKGFQPKVGGHANHPLWLLHRLDIIEKHQGILAAGIALSATTSGNEGASLFSIANDGTVIYAAPIPEDHFKPQFSVTVAFGREEIGATITMIRHIYDFISDKVIPAFDQFFE